MPEVVFNQQAHTYHLGGRRLPSVTEILQPLDELDGIPIAVLRAAAEFGTHVHLACHLHDAGRLDRAALDPALEPYLRAWESFLSESGATVVASEYRVSHPLGYAGTMDKALHFPNRRQGCVGDIKSSDVVPRSAGPQTAAYREAGARELNLSRTRYAIHLRPDATYRLHKYENTTDWSIFQSALNIWRWRNG